MEWTVILTAVVGISGVVLGWLGRSRTVKQDAAADAGRDATLSANVAHIRQSVDDMRVDIRVQGQRYDQLAERVTRVEESAKQAHKRLDVMRGSNN